jgi:ribonuclease-3
MNQKLEKFEKLIGYTFKDKGLLFQAVTHSSYAYENQEQEISDNEVMEFLGDSVLGLVVADFLCSKYPNLPEGELSKLKSAAASTTALYNFAKVIKLNKYVLLGKGEEKSGGSKKRTILAGTYEAVIAAVYKDGGIEEAKKFLSGSLESLFKKLNLEKFFINNYKSALQEYLQKNNLPAPIYKTVSIKGPDHNKCFTVEVFSKQKKLAQAKGRSKKDAEQRAAQKAVRKFWGTKMKTLMSDTFLMKKRNV